MTGVPSRRTVLKAGLVAAGAACCSGLVGPGGSTRLAFAAAGTAGAAGMSGSADATPYDGDVLVVLSLRGGFDGLSAVVPGADPDYRRARPTIRVPTAALAPLDATFGLHPALAPLLPLWTAGVLGVVHAVGMADPTRSHFDAQERMEQAAPGTSTRTGWLDRLLGAPAGQTPFQAVQVGAPTLPESLAGPAVALSMRSLGDFRLAGRDWMGPRLPAALRALHAEADPRVARSASATLATVETAAALAATPAGSGYPVDGPGQELGAALRDVARIVRGRVGLRAATVDLGDWDMHADLGTVDRGRLTPQLDGLARAVAAFAADLGPDLARVTLVTLSEFGRRVEENGSGGADHGHGNAMLMLGGGVVGGRVHGRWPGLSPAALVDGDLAGTTDYRDVLGEILQRRCGVGDLTPVFPGLRPAPLGLVRGR